MSMAKDKYKVERQGREHEGLVYIGRQGRERLPAVCVYPGCNCRGEKGEEMSSCWWQRCTEAERKQAMLREASHTQKHTQQIQNAALGVYCHGVQTHG